PDYWPDSRVWVCGCDGKPRWELSGLPSISDAHLLPGGRLLSAHYLEPGQLVRKGQRFDPTAIRDFPGVIERDLNGQVIWQYRGERQPLACRRLSSGATLVLSEKYVLEEVTIEKTKTWSRRLEPTPDGHRPFPPFLLDQGRVLYRHPVASLFAQFDAKDGTLL